MLKPTKLLGMGAAALICACAAEPSAPAADAISAASAGNGAVIEAGDFTHVFGLGVIDWDNHLLLYYRWDDGFCGGVASTFSSALRR